MSRYQVLALMREVNQNPEALARFRTNPTGFVAGWPGPLTDAEATALAGRDYATLYAAGAHPFLLWSFTEAVLTPEVPRPELVESFRAAAAAAGYPDFGTTPL